MIRYAIIIEKAADGGYGAYVPDLPGCVGMGDSHESALQNVAEAIKFHLDGMKEEGLPIPAPSSEVENIVIEYA
jgi:predicted RNase H-like HicB family nuclease